MLKLRPFERGDQVVFCPAARKVKGRGSKHTVTDANGALTIRTTRSAANEKSYDYRPVSACAKCVFRQYQIIGAQCPEDFEQIKEIDEQSHSDS